MAYVPQDPLVPGVNFSSEAPPNASSAPAQMTPQQAATFTQLVQTYGLSSAIQIMRLIDPNAPLPTRALGGAQLASGGLQAASAAGFNVPPALSALGSGLGTAAGLAGTGYQLANILSNENLSTTQKVGNTGRTVADTLMSLLIPYYGLAKGVSVAGDILQRSGSPEVRGVGRVASYGAEPAGAKAFWDVATGMRSPAAAIKAAGGAQGALLDTMGPVGLIFRGLGKSLPGFPSPPSSQGGQFRDKLGRVFDKFKLPININFQDRSAYNAPDLTKLSPQANQAANAWADMLSGPLKLSPDYRTQAVNILLNNYGNDVPKFLAEFQKQAGPAAPPAAPMAAKMPSPANPAAGGDVGTLVNQQMASRRQNALPIIQQIMAMMQQNV